jgi:hypothetical protein
MSVTRWRSSCAPVEMSPKISSSATRPPSRDARRVRRGEERLDQDQREDHRDEIAVVRVGAATHHGSPCEWCLRSPSQPRCQHRNARRQRVSGVALRGPSPRMGQSWGTRRPFSPLRTGYPLLARPRFLERKQTVRREWLASAAVANPLHTQGRCRRRHRRTKGGLTQPCESTAAHG